jgi:hypothetical protein
MKDKILDYLNEELSPTQRVDFENALAKDPNLQQEFDFQKDKWMQLKTAHLKQVAQAKAKTWAAGADALHRQQKVVRLRVLSFAAAACLAMVLFNPSLLDYWRRTKIDHSGTVSTPPKNQTASSSENGVVAGASGDNTTSTHQTNQPDSDSLLKISLKSLIPQKEVFLQRLETEIQAQSTEKISIKTQLQLKKLVSAYYEDNIDRVALEPTDSDALWDTYRFLNAIYRMENQGAAVNVFLDKIKLPNLFKDEKDLYLNILNVKNPDPKIAQDARQVVKNVLERLKKTPKHIHSEKISKFESYLNQSK